MSLDLKSDSPKFDLVDLGGKRYFRVTEDWHILNYVVKAGFVFNGQSMPWVLRWLLGGKGDPETLPESCLHDWLYDGPKIKRYLADAVMRNMLRSRRKRRAWPYYFALRLYCLFKYSEWKLLLGKT